MPYPFLLSYARKDAKKFEGGAEQADPHFEAFLNRLNQRVMHYTGAAGFVDTQSIQPGQDWSDELAEALGTAETMVCLYSPSYFQSEHCGKEMQVFLDRRRRYMRTNFGKKPSNIIPIVWQPIPLRIPKTLPDIEYRDTFFDPDNRGVWDLGDQGQSRELLNIADQIAIRVRNAGDDTPLEAYPERPCLNAMRSAFLPPQLPLPE